MSREQFTGNTCLGPDTEWREALHYEPLSGRTEDPRAKDFDDAVELFQSGLKLARHRGDLEAACDRIATAYLLHEPSFKFCGSYPHPEAANDCGAG